MPLFSPFQLGDLELASRIVMAPMTRNRAKDGNAPHELNARYYEQRASAGLIISEATQVSRQGIGYPATPGIHSPEQARGWKLVTDAVHAAGGKIFAQLWHCGRISHSLWQEDGGAPVSSSPIAANGTAYTPQGSKQFETPRELAVSEIPAVIEQFVAGARNALAAGFDGVEIHGANGYLIDQFLRDGVNRRGDRYGGSPENRSRFALELTEAVARVAGSKRVGFRISPSSGFNDMSDSDPAATFGYLVRKLNDLNLAYLHLIEPEPGAAQNGGPLLDASFFRPIYRGALMVNSAYDRERAEAGLRDGQFDLVSFGKPFIANPDLPLRMKNGIPLSAHDMATVYGGGASGYTDYPAAT